MWNVNNSILLYFVRADHYFFIVYLAFLNIVWFNTRVCACRSNVSDSSILEVLHWYTSVNAALLDHLTNQIKETDNSGVWRYAVFF